MISIIVPFYNTEKYLEECLSSIRAQTFSDYECLMIDDGSTDSSRSIAQKYADKDNRFILLNDHHIGFPLAKNLGLDNARGEYICFVDSDDYILPTYLEELYKGITETNSDICKCSLVRFKNNDKPKITEWPYIVIVKKEKDDIMRFMFQSTFMWDKIYKRELFNGLRFDDVEALSDTMLSYKIFERARGVCGISPVLICHRDHNENMTYNVRHFSPTYWEHRVNVYLTMCSYLMEHYPKLEGLVKYIFKSEYCTFIKPHLSKEVYNYYLNKEEVKKLLGGVESGK